MIMAAVAMRNSARQKTAARRFIRAGGDSADCRRREHWRHAMADAIKDEAADDPDVRKPGYGERSTRDSHERAPRPREVLGPFPEGCSWIRWRHPTRSA